MKRLGNNQVETYAYAEMATVFDNRLRSESRASRGSGISSADHAEVVHTTLNALVDDVNKTTELIRRRQKEMIIERRTFQSEMEVNGRISVEPSEDWLNLRLKSVSTDDMKKELGKIKEHQRSDVVGDTLAALVYDVNATAEVLRRGSLKKKRDGKRVKHEEVEYRLRLTPGPDDEILAPQEEEILPPHDSKFTVEQVNRNYGVDISESQMSSLKRRARSTTPRRTLQIGGSPPPGAAPICAYCSEEIEGPTLTALAPNAERAQKFHPYHFMCCYCQKALNLRGTFREHERKPYCHECFYKLYNGLLYSPDENQKVIEKLI
uniref:LIM zinc-binding domain-containing protein n=1 Tax=Panagrellus redivivus TaxID=6233 RepID=A0A7E4ZSF3_PANRE